MDKTPEGAFDAKRELVAFYERHFDELTERCLACSRSSDIWSPLNTLPVEERRTWVRVGFNAVISAALGHQTDIDERVYFPHVSEISDAPIFGMGDIVDSCECALLPDDAILPLLWDDYSSEPQKLYQLVVAFREAQNQITKRHVRQKIDDFTAYVDFARGDAVASARAELSRDLYRRFYLALKALQDKTCDVYSAIGTYTDDVVRSEVTQLKMIEADLLSEVFRITSDSDVLEPATPTRGASPSFFDRCRQHGLTERECEVVAMVAQGLSNKEISDELGIAQSTVKNSLSTILSKLGKKGRAQIVAFAARNGFFG